MKKKKVFLLKFHTIMFLEGHFIQPLYVLELLNYFLRKWKKQTKIICYAW